MGSGAGHRRPAVRITAFATMGRVRGVGGPAAAGPRGAFPPLRRRTRASAPRTRGIGMSASSSRPLLAQAPRCGPGPPRRRQHAPRLVHRPEPELLGGEARHGPGTEVGPRGPGSWLHRCPGRDVCRGRRRCEQGRSCAVGQWADDEQQSARVLQRASLVHTAGRAHGVVAAESSWHAQSVSGASIHRRVRSPAPRPRAPSPVHPTAHNLRDVGLLVPAAIQLRSCSTRRSDADRSALLFRDAPPGAR